MEYHSIMIKNEVVPIVETWMDPEIITLSGVRQIQHDYHLYVESKI